MAALNAWYKVVTPREDLRQQKPLDAAEFAVHLDQVRDGRAPSVYQNPNEFFERTYLTRKLSELGVEVLRRLSGEVNQASAVFNLATQFGGGKTHALTMLYHLAEHGEGARRWRGVHAMLEAAAVPHIPNARVAVFVGQQFDSLKGRGGDDGTPFRKTPWGEIAFQLGGEASFNVVAEHDERGIAPGGDAIRAMLPTDRPLLILMDEVMNYVNHARRLDLAGQFYNFVQNLSEEARSRRGAVLVVSIPASELEMSADDERDYQSLKKLLDRLGKPLIISAEHETAEIIRRRLFEWTGINDDAKRTISAYAEWATEHSQQLAEGLSGDRAWQVFAETYPFHPTVLSVFERKWQALPRFQRTRGVLQLLARWVSKAYHEGYSGAHRDPLIDLGTAPLDDPDFRTAVFEQLGEERLEAAVTTDVAGKGNAHALVLDREAQDTLKRARLHRKVATTIFFESNGGQARMEATVPEIRLAVGAPGLDIGNVETALDALSEACYYLSIERNRYRFSTRENLIKKHADYRAQIGEARIQERIEAEIKKAFNLKAALTELRRTEPNAAVGAVFFPTNSGEIPNEAQITFVILSPNLSASDPAVVKRIESWTRESGTTSRTFKNALIWCVADDVSTLRDRAKKAIAWEDIQDEIESSPRGADTIDSQQRHQLGAFVTKSGGDLEEAVWHAYRKVLLLGKNGMLQSIDLGLVHSSAATTPINLIINRLMNQGDIEVGVGVGFLLRNWPAMREWETRSVKNAFFAAPQFPRLLNPMAVRETIARGLNEGMLAYVSNPVDGNYTLFRYRQPVHANEIEINEEVCIIKAETAEAYLTTQKKSATIVPPLESEPVIIAPVVPDLISDPDPLPDPSPKTQRISLLRWRGEVTPLKWTIFYTKVLSRFARDNGLRIIVQFEVQSDISAQKLDETLLALKEMGLSDEVETS